MAKFNFSEQQKWIPFIEVECSDERVRVYEACKKPYCFETAMRAARIMREEHQSIGGRVLVTGVEKAKPIVASAGISGNNVKS